MYEAILGILDAVAASLGLIRENQRVRQGINPWGYSGGTTEASSSVQVNRKNEEVIHEGAGN
jgi:hypothetical protein